MEPSLRAPGPLRLCSQCHLLADLAPRSELLLPLLQIAEQATALDVLAGNELLDYLKTLDGGALQELTGRAGEDVLEAMNTFIQRLMGASLAGAALQLLYTSHLRLGVGGRSRALAPRSALPARRRRGQAAMRLCWLRTAVVAT